jgi:polysaccharide pyruvyl transferase WcaK-like protein
VASIAAAVDELAVKYGARSMFVPFGGSADAEAATLVIRKCRSKPMLVPLEGLDAVAAAMSRAKLVIGVRLHALILAIRFGVPFLAVPYDPKVRGLCDDVGYPLASLWTPGVRSTPEDAARLASEAWSRLPELGAHLREAAGLMRERAERNFDVLATLAGRADARREPFGFDA